MPANDFKKIKTDLIAKLGGLSPQLTYHCINHTLDMMEQAVRIAHQEGVADSETIYLLKVAALYHDCGFLETYAAHEIKSCHIFIRDAVNLEFTDSEKEIICGLIMATKIPQQPKTHMEKILCDADLDYLGRNDFAEISDTLRQEFLHYKIVPDNNAWHALQINFLQNHRYHTSTSQKEREAVKQQNLSRLITRE